MEAKRGQLFLRDIAANPDDDAPRLVYADWLEEHGAPAERARGEFIRMQCRLSRLPEACSQRRELRRGAAKLLATYGPDWLGPLHHPAFSWHFHRGFAAALGHAGLFHGRHPADGPPEGASHGWVRFYPDGTLLICRTTDATAAQVARWFNRRHAHAFQGRYTFCPIPGAVSVFFVAASGAGLVTAPGTLAGTSLVLDLHCPVNDYRARHAYTWEDVPGYDSRIE
jgi:uncharacterized protein (TIGR02996 family)